jgi:glycosyltransferase involved in cell wall biosynthesis
MRIALVHDWLNQMGGAEDVLDVLMAMYPDAPVYTSLYAPKRMPERYRERDIRPMWTDRLPGIHARHQRYLPAYPIAWGGLDLSEYDLIISNKSGFCHGFRKRPDAWHVCYCLTPTRYVWQLDHYLEQEPVGRAARLGLRALTPRLQRWDRAAADRVTHFVAISEEVRTRIRRFYGQPSTLVYPPVDTARFAPEVPSTAGDYYLVVSRLVPYKRIDLAVKAATRLGVRLIVAGTGRDLERLQAMAGPTIEFPGYVPDDALPRLMAESRAYIFPGLEDFGITPVQAQAAGRPVIAWRGGGALDTVVEGVTGAFFTEPSVDSLVATLERFDASAYDPQAIQANAARFSQQVFADAFRATIAQVIAEPTPNRRSQ